MKKYMITMMAMAMLSSVASATPRQEQDNWCWAACIQECMLTANRPVSQAEIVARLTGWVQNRPAGIPEVVTILRSYGFRAWQAGRPGSPQELYQGLLSGWKMIAFVRPTDGPVGHYIVLEGVEPRFGGIVVSDPWTGITQPIMLNGLYNGWRWVDSIVVGPPAF